VASLLSQLEARRHQLSSAIRELESNLAALDVVIAAERKGIGQSGIELPPAPARISNPLRWRPESLTGQVESLINGSPDKQWTSGDLYCELRDRPKEDGVYHLPGDHLKGRNAVSAALNWLFQAGRISRVTRPIGRTPAVYRAKEKEISMTEAS